MTHERGSSTTASDYRNGPNLVEDAERLLHYWEQHGENPEVAAQWAIHDMLGFLRLIVPEASESPDQ